MDNGGSNCPPEECDNGGDYRLTSEQRERTIKLLADSDSLRHFVTDCIRSSDIGCDLSTDEIISAYFDYCAARTWEPFPSKIAERNLTDLMLEIHHSNAGANLMRKDNVTPRTSVSGAILGLNSPLSIMSHRHEANGYPVAFTTLTTAIFRPGWAFYYVN